ncbi:family 43 glycosylhydrolase [Paenibacillus daejeonensis]|uniref:family 43 glycosylhydrolase n=1 Tax=Paenibacillus daejeonensis TaxID=135193 RepID=UPI00036EBD35|nr:family 43 glycosylhydrolase [Paenibacillus daejeonensis]
MSSYETVYTNPFPSLEEEWDDYGNGDPYVLRYDGRYYLYVSTKDHRVGIKAWESDDLVHWRYAGLVADDPVTTGAYAPEVVYHNGFFYLYTSPAGAGHYVFRSTSPTGPFERITDNLGMSIDGSVFIDDDGSWFFTHAGTEGIVGVPMNDPVTFGYGRAIDGTFLGHWTEGSMIIKRNGVYYMTLTGNHVFSKGYRVHYAISTESALGPYHMPANNLLAISVDSEFFGLGHSSTVMGPDLDSYYLVYHNLVGSSAEGPPVRRMNIDRLVFNGQKMSLLGPTNYDQPVPRLPDFADRLDEGHAEDKWLVTPTERGSQAISLAATADHFTAEYNLQPLSQADDRTQVELLFGYQNENHFGRITFNWETGIADVQYVENGSSQTLAEAVLPPDIDWTKLHAIRLERAEAQIRLYVDGRQMLEAPMPLTIDGGAIGYRYEGGEPRFSYIAFANAVDGSSDFETAKPLPGIIEAVHYLREAGRGYHMDQQTSDSDMRVSDGTNIRQISDGSHSLTLHTKGDWVRYAANISRTGNYALDFTIGDAAASAKFEILVDGESAGIFNLGRQDELLDEPLVKVHAGALHLEKGIRDIQIKLLNGPLEWVSAEFRYTATEPAQADQLLEHSSATDVHGAWSREADRYIGAADRDVKWFGGDPGWTDYRIESTVEVGEDASGETGILVRVTQESDFEHQVRDAMLGYYVSISSGKLNLYKLNYDSTLLHAVRLDIPHNEPVRLAVEVEGGTLRAYWADEPEPVLTYHDPHAFMQGRVGIRSVYAEELTIGDLSVTPLPEP